MKQNDFSEAASNQPVIAGSSRRRDGSGWTKLSVIAGAFVVGAWGWNAVAKGNDDADFAVKVVQNVEGAHPTDGASQFKTNCEPGGISLGAYRLSAWKSDKFDGSACRIYDEPLSQFKVSVDVRKGGYDAGLGQPTKSVLLDEISPSLTLTTTFTQSVATVGNGRWWIGPKTIISKTAGWESLKGNYECYVIDKASEAPDKLLDKVGGTNKTYRGQSVHNGSVYKHYSLDIDDFQQIWSIRQNYRDGGTTDVGAIQTQWRKLGLVPNVYSLGWKYNVEFAGQNKGEFTFRPPTK